MTIPLTLFIISSLKTQPLDVKNNFLPWINLCLLHALPHQIACLLLFKTSPIPHYLKRVLARTKPWSVLSQTQLTFRHLTRIFLEKFKNLPDQWQFPLHTPQLTIAHPAPLSNSLLAVCIVCDHITDVLYWVFFFIIFRCDTFSIFAGGKTLSVLQELRYLWLGSCWLKKKCGRGEFYNLGYWEIWGLDNKKRKEEGATENPTDVETLTGGLYVLI